MALEGTGMTDQAVENAEVAEKVPDARKEAFGCPLFFLLFLYTLRTEIKINIQHFRFTAECT
jgi:uncharacterized protein YcgL (UPF0745 family)